VITVDLAGRGALVTGGTRGLGKAIAMELARTGATVFVTHRWGSVDPAALAEEFRAEGLAPPRVVESDASDPAATRALMAEIGRAVGALHVVVSNVAFSKVVRGLEDLKKSSLDLSLGYSAWPLVDLAQASREVLGRCPPYLVAVSGDGAQVCHEGYDMAGVSKAVLETLVRYLAVRLKREGVRVNAIRPSSIDSESLRATFGDAAVAQVRARVGEVFLDPRRVARSCVALASGLLDAMTGQVLVIDEGWSLVSPLAYVTGREAPFDFPPDAGPDEGNSG
jgi:NAD(P)-dependent dehydrogenase (short-subunit alcohol dehydrogenase family)